MKIFVNDLKPGDFITDQPFSIESIQQHKTRSQKPYYRLVIQDRTGEVAAKIWENDFENCNMRGVEAGDVIKIDGEVSEYKGKLQVIIKKLQKTKDYDITDLLQASTKDIDQMFEDILEIINNVKNKHIKKLLKKLLSDDTFINLFKRSPAAEMVHHDYIGGLMEHILEMHSLSQAFLAYYEGVDEDLVTAGIILHDIGKVFELEVRNTAIKRTKKGRLIGHLLQGIELIQAELPKDFPEDLWMKLLHIIASHHHKIDNSFGSPVKQSTIEAAIVHVVDYASSHVRQFQKAINLGEGREPGFSDYQKWIATQVYLD